MYISTLPELSEWTLLNNILYLNQKLFNPKKFLVNMGGGFCPAPVTFEFVDVLRPKLGTLIEFCIFYLERKELNLLIYANEVYDVILLFSSPKKYRNSNHCKIVIFKLVKLKFAVWIDKR